jgi:DeoR/GlpR family transcriptional regulator of sugar metabolism
MIRDERKEYIEELISKRGSISIKDLAKELNVSYATIRRDLSFFEKKGIIKRTHGGAINKNIQKKQYSFNIGMDVNKEEKKAIALEASKLLKEGDIIFIEMSSSGLYLCDYLSKFKNLTVFTNGCEIAYSAANNNPDIAIYITGGYLIKDTHILTGNLAENSIKNLNFDKAFIGITAIDVIKGITSISYLEVNTKQSIIQSAQTVIGLADFSKFGNFCIHKIAAIKELDILITDDKTDPEHIERIKKAGVKIIFAH